MHAIYEMTRDQSCGRIGRRRGCARAVLPVPRQAALPSGQYHRPNKPEPTELDENTTNQQLCITDPKAI